MSELPSIRTVDIAANLLRDQANLKPVLHDVPLRLNRRTMRALAALRKILKAGDGPIVARAVAELAERHLPKKRRKRNGN